MKNVVTLALWCASLVYSHSASVKRGGRLMVTVVYDDIVRCSGVYVAVAHCVNSLMMVCDIRRVLVFDSLNQM